MLIFYAHSLFAFVEDLNFGVCALLLAVNLIYSDQFWVLFVYKCLLNYSKLYYKLYLKY
jgi:hypothetical protein